MIEAPQAASKGVLASMSLFTSALVLACALGLACSGGGGPSGPNDRTPPGAPRVELLRADLPNGGRSTVIGLPGAVEGRAIVVLENVSGTARTGSAMTAETRAGVDGAFATQIEAVLGDELSILARDDAGNRGAAVRVKAGPDTGTFRLVDASGSGQTGVSGRPLTEPFSVRVRGGVPPSPLGGVDVIFDVVQGSGVLTTSRAPSDADGIARSTLTLPAVQGAVRVRARIEAAAGQEAFFDAMATGAPELTGVTPGEGDRGSTVTITGRNFSPIPAHNIVEFNEVEAEVLASGLDRLSVAVPAFGSNGPVTVTLTGVRSNGLPFVVKGPPPVLQSVGTATTNQLAPGPGGLTTEVRLGFLTGNEQYVLAVQSLAQGSGSTFRHSLAADEAALVPVGESAAQAQAVPAAGQARLDGLLRLREAEIARDMKGKPRDAGIRLAGGEPQVGDTRVFQVINTLSPSASITDTRNFDEVHAVLRYKGVHTLVYLDARVGAPNISDAEIREVGDRFDTRSYQTDRGAFGNESDIDDDGRVTILLTATVNELNRGAQPQDGIVIGFFFGLDLLPAFSPETSNAGEIFYGFVPDPSGQFGVPIPREFALPTLNEVFAHELQHMISFNEHVLVRDGQSEDLWLNEGLSHIAEDLNGFEEGNDIRTALYLSSPGSAGLALSAGGNGLAERGASFVFLRHLGDQVGEDVFRELVQTNATGTGNVELATGRAFRDLFADWFAALYLDDAGAADARFQIPSLTLRRTYEEVRSLNPSLGLGPFLALQSLRVPGANPSNTTVGTSGAFYEIGTDRGTAERKVRISSPFSSQSQVTVIRAR
ncbi:MAG: IPT/TIG domain-containing protein [Gemmatimonadetes bacterium]|nr:IPT/TIG domain-containing protein [Gemmatimonadota bacterium]